jgi:hypothetical protein
VLLLLLLVLPLRVARFDRQPLHQTLDGGGRALKVPNQAAVRLQLELVGGEVRVAVVVEEQAFAGRLELGRRWRAACGGGMDHRRD